MSHVGDVPPTEVGGWTFEGITTKVKPSITFPPTTAPGATVWACAVWYNARAESSPPSEPLATRIAGSLGFSRMA